MKSFFFSVLFVSLLTCSFSAAAGSLEDSTDIAILSESAQSSEYFHPILKYRLGDGDHNPDKLLALARLAERGDAVAQNILAMEYMFATDRAARDIDRAVFWYKKSADQGHLYAQKTLATVYMPIVGERPNVEEAFYWNLKAAEQGDAYSQLNVSSAYIYAKGIDQDFLKGLLWLRKSALSGESEAQRILGVRYLEGNGVAQDSHEALRWLEKSAAQGNINAQVEVIKVLYNGDGIKKDYVKAFKLARAYVDDVSISGNVVYSSDYDSNLYYTLGEMYQYGRGTRQDINKAKESYKLSCDEDAKQEGCNKYRELSK